MKTLENVCSLAFGSNRADLELFGARFGEFGALSFKTTRGWLLFTRYDVFDVIGWFPRENIHKREFTCELC